MLTVNLQDRTTTFSCDECPRTVVRRGVIAPRIVPVSPRFPDGRWYPLPRGWVYRRLTVWSEVAVWGPFRDFVPATRTTIRLLCPKCRRRPSADALDEFYQETYVVDVRDTLTGVLPPCTK